MHVSAKPRNRVRFVCGVWAGSLLFLSIIACACFVDIFKVCLQLSRVSIQNRPAEWQPQDKNHAGKNQSILKGSRPIIFDPSSLYFVSYTYLLLSCNQHIQQIIPSNKKILCNIDRAFARRVCHMSASFRVKLMARPSPMAAFGWRTLRRPSPPGTVPHHPSSWTSVLAWIPRWIHS